MTRNLKSKRKHNYFTLNKDDLVKSVCFFGVSHDQLTNTHTKTEAERGAAGNSQ